MTTSRSIEFPRRRPDRARGAAALAVLLLVAGAAGSAQAARKRVVVVPFDGPQADSAQEEVANVIRRKHAVVAAEGYQKKRRDLGIRNDSDESTARVAHALGVDAVVGGQVKRQGGKWELEITVRDGGSGGIVARIPVPLSGPKLDQEATQRIAAELMPSLLQTDGHAGSGEVASRGGKDDEGGDEGGADEGGGESAEADEGEDAQPVKKKAKKGKKRKARKSDDDEEEDEEAAADDSAGEGGLLPLRTIEVGAGLGVVGRSFNYNNKDLQPYSSLWPSLAVFAQSFPFHDRDDALAKVGIGFSAANEPLANAKLPPDNNGNVVSHKVTQWRVLVDVRYALRLGDGFLLMPNLGIGQTYFGLGGRDGNDYNEPSKCNGSANICVADVIVTHAKVGADSRLALSPEMTLDAELAVLPSIAVGAGDGQVAGNSDGASDFVLGLGFNLGLSYKLSDVLALRGGLNLLRFGHSLSGAPACGNTNPCYSSATDTYYGFTAGAVYLY